MKANIKSIATDLSDALSTRDEFILKISLSSLQKIEEVKYQDEKKKTLNRAVIKATLMGWLFGLEEILKAGGDPNYVSDDFYLRRGWDIGNGYYVDEVTPLILSAQNGNKNTTKLLLTYGANRSARTREGIQAIHVALCSKGLFINETIEMLMPCEEGEMLSGIEILKDKMKARFKASWLALGSGKVALSEEIERKWRDDNANYVEAWCLQDRLRGRDFIYENDLFKKEAELLKNDLISAENMKVFHKYFINDNTTFEGCVCLLAESYTERMLLEMITVFGRKAALIEDEGPLIESMLKAGKMTKKVMLALMEVTKWSELSLRPDILKALYFENLYRSRQGLKNEDFDLFDSLLERQKLFEESAEPEKGSKGRKRI